LKISRRQAKTNVKPDILRELRRKKYQIYLVYDEIDIDDDDDADDVYLVRVL